MEVKKEIIEFDSITEFDSDNNIKMMMMIKREVMFQDQQEQDATDLDLYYHNGSDHNNMEEILMERVSTLMKAAQQDDKLKHLPLLITLLSNKNHQIQSKSLHLGILRIAAMWLQPLPNGTLPDVTIRTNILQSLTTEFHAPNLSQPDITRFKHQVVDSGLATAVSKLSDNSDEIEANKKMAKDLIINWLYYFYYYNNHQNTTSTTSKKPSVQQKQAQRKTTTAKGNRGLGAKGRIDKKIRQLHYSHHRKFNCAVPAY